jgi:hypothetical protein
MDILRQLALQAPLETQQKLLDLSAAQQNFAVNQAILGTAQKYLGLGGQDQPSAAFAGNPSNQPSATGGGGSSGGSVGSNVGPHVSLATGNGSTGAPSPTSTQTGTAPSGVGNQYATGGYNPDVGVGTIAGVPVPLAISLDSLRPGYLKRLQEAQDSQVKTAQLQAQGPINALESVRNTADPRVVVDTNPGLKANFVRTAQVLGLDPLKALADVDLTRQVLGFQANQIRGQAALPAVNYAPPEQIVRGPAGEVYTQNPITHELKQVTGENLKQVAGPNGPVYLPSDQAAGKTPFNASIFGASNISQQALDAAYNNWNANGRPNSPPGGFGRTPQMASKFWDYAGQQDAATGNSAGAAKAYAAANKADGSALDQQTKLLSNVTSYGATLDKNIALLKDAESKNDLTGSPLINRALNDWRQGITGNPETAKTVAALTAVSTEVAKIQSGALGNTPISDSLRGEISGMINKNMSPAALNGALDIFVQEGANRRGSIQDQIDSLKSQIANRQVPGSTSSANGGGGVPGASPAFNNARTALGLGNGNQSPAAAAPVRVNSPEEALKLKPGTVFVTPDGRTKVR